MKAPTKREPAKQPASLSADDLAGYEELSTWLVVSVGEGVQPFDTKEEAVSAAKDQAIETPDLILGVYRLQHFVSARVQAPQLFNPERAAS
jgi:hypothetical protein